MKGKKCFGLLLALSIIFGLSLNVFSNANAVDLTQNVSYLGILSASTYNYQNVGSCTVSNGGIQGYVTNTSSTSCNVSSRVNLQTSSGFNDQYILGVTTYVYELRDREPLNSYNNEVPTLELYSDNSYQTSLQYVGTSIQNLSESSAAVTQYFKFNTTGNLVAGTSILRLYNRIGLQINEYMMIGTQVEVLALANYNITVNTNSQDVVNAINQLKSSNEAWQQTINTNIQSLLQIIRDNQSSQSQQQQQEQQDRDNMEDQQSDISTDSDSSQQSAESTGTTLLGAFTGFVTALTSATPSNCNINMDLGNLDLGVVNLCQLSLPQPLPTIASIMLILFCVPLSIATARKVINLFRSFQS